MAMKKYEVIRAHEGDKPYAVGDIREADENDVSHLIGKVLRKAAPGSNNKAAPKSKNKGS